MATQATLRYIASDILRSLQQNYDSAEIALPQVIYWIMIHADRLKKMYLGQANYDSGAFVNSFLVDVAVDPDNGRNYFVLPVSIYDFDQERGIEYITYSPGIDSNTPVFTSVQFTRTTIPKSSRLYMREDETPSPSNPFFYRISDRIYFLGVEQIDILEAEVGLKTSFQPVNSALDIDVVFDFPQELLPQLKRELLAMGLFVLKTPKEFNMTMLENRFDVVTLKDLPE